MSTRYQHPKIKVVCYSTVETILSGSGPSIKVDGRGIELNPSAAQEAPEGMNADCKNHLWMDEEENG